MKKGYILAAFFGVIALFGTVFALNPTVFTDLKATNFQVSTIYDSSGNTRFATGTTNAITGNATVSGTLAVTGATTVSTMTVTGTQGLKLTGGFITVGTDTPTVTGVLAYASGYTLYVGTGTANALQWVKIGSQ